MPDTVPLSHFMTNRTSKGWYFEFPNGYEAEVGIANHSDAALFRFSLIAYGAPLNCQGSNLTVGEVEVRLAAIRALPKAK